MNLPTVQQHSSLEKAVSARELYGFLEPTERFSSWFDRQLQYGFVDGQDYLGCEVFNTQARQNLSDFAMTVDMAKEISMIQRSAKGKHARQYFIECERKLSQPVAALPQDYLSALKALVDSEEQKQIAQAQITQLQPKAEALDKISHSKGSLGIREAAKALGMGQNDFVNWCIDDSKPVSARYMYRDEFTGRLNAYSHRIKQGFISQHMSYFIDRGGIDRAKPKVKFTPAGLTKIAETMQKERVREVELM